MSNLSLHQQKKNYFGRIDKENGVYFYLRVFTGNPEIMKWFPYAENYGGMEESYPGKVDFVVPKDKEEATVNKLNQVGYLERK